MLEDTNTVDWEDEAKQSHIIVCHEEIRLLREENDKLKKGFEKIVRCSKEEYCRRSLCAESVEKSISLLHNAKLTGKNLNWRFPHNPFL